MRSPDVVGSCVVDVLYRAYVKARFGSSDFCADLDGSGVVDVLDLAFVDSMLGDYCSDAPGAVPRDDSAFPSGSLSFSLAPNPAHERAEITLHGTETATVFDLSLGAALRNAFPYSRRTTSACSDQQIGRTLRWAQGERK